MGARILLVISVINLAFLFAEIALNVLGAGLAIPPGLKP